KETQQRGTDGEIHFQLLSDTRYLDELNQLLASLFLHTPLSQPQVRQLGAAVRELGANAIEWGHQKQVDRPVTVTYHIDPQKVPPARQHPAPDFTPAKLPHAANADDPVAHMQIRESLGRREGGFGILRARGLVDELRYNATGNEVRLVKCFPPQA